MATLKTTARFMLSLLPSLREWFAEVDLLRRRSNELQRDNRDLKFETEVLKERLQAASDELVQVKAARPVAYENSQPLWTPPGHFYSPIPSSEILRRSEDEIFTFPPALRGIDLNEERQLELLKAFSGIYREEPFAPEKLQDGRYAFQNPNYSYGDAIILYGMIRHLRPQRIVEIGSGHSSCAILDVNHAFFNDSIACTFIDPFPQLLRSLIRPEDSHQTRVIAQPVQDVNVDVFRALESSDILFIDSSHVAKTGSDVNYILFKILPLLNEGVYIHFHDIFYPFEYPREWVFEGRAWNEAYLLRAFLQYNRAFEIQFFATYLLYKHRGMFEAAVPCCMENPGANFWMRKVLYDPKLERVHETSPPPLKLPPRRIDPFQAACGSWLREGWHRPESGHCWMEGFASLELAGPDSAGQRLKVRAHSPHANGATLSAAVDEFDLGSVQLQSPGIVEAEFMLPATVVGKSPVMVYLKVDRVIRIPGDFRNLGLSVHAVEIM